MCFITFNKGYVVFPSPEIKFLPINIFWGIYDFFFCEIFEPQRVKILPNSEFQVKHNPYPASLCYLLFSLSDLRWALVDSK